MAIKTFTVGEVLTASDTNTYLANAGLVYVSNTTWVGAASSVPVANCFSSTYDNYFVLVSGVTYSVSDTTLLMLPDNYTATAAYYGGGFYQQYGVGALNAYVLSASNGGGGVGITSTVPMNHAIDVFSPYLAQQTRMGGHFSLGGNYTAQYSSVLTTTGSYTGFTLKPASGTMTGGSITVYGYRKA